VYFVDELSSILSNVFDEPVRFISRHVLKTVKAVKEMKGNAWVMIWTTFFWTIPSAWLGVYANIYMNDLGVSPQDIGNIGSLSILMQLLTIIWGGYLSDRVGRKKLLIISDIVTWIPSMALMIFAQNVWYFVASVVIRGFGMLANPAWKCLCIEDTKPEQRSRVFSLMAITGSISGLSAPLGGFFVKWFGLITACRIMYSILFFAVCAGIYARWLMLKDSPVSSRLAKEAKQAKGIDFKKYYLDIIKAIWKNINFRWFMILQVLTTFTFTMWNTFYPVFLADKNRGLGLNKSDISIIPFITSIVFLSSTMISISALKPKHYRKSLLLLSALPVFGATLFVLTPSGTMIFVLVSFVINNIWGSFWGPIAESYSLSIMNEKARARILSVYITIQLVLVAPAGMIAGRLYTAAPRLLFSVILCLTIAIYTIVYFRFKPGKFAVSR